jgi:hypothetical protein
MTYKGGFKKRTRNLQSPIRVLFAPQIDGGTKRGEHHGGRDNPQGVKWHMPAMDRPNDQDAFYGDKYPADDKQLLDAAIARRFSGDSNFLDESIFVGLGRLARNQLEQVGEHRGSSLVKMSRKESPGCNDGSAGFFNSLLAPELFCAMFRHIPSNDSPS